MNEDVIFGVGEDPDNPSVLWIYFSEKAPWDQKRDISYTLPDDHYNLLLNSNFEEVMECIFKYVNRIYKNEDDSIGKLGKQLDKEELIEKVTKLGFVYNKYFELYMIEELK